ncbi:unnamed protein product, partial [Sphagnum troendelagicum]
MFKSRAMKLSSPLHFVDKKFFGGAPMTPATAPQLKWIHVRRMARCSVSTESQSTWKWRLLIAYDGSKYSGWQLQPGTLTVQHMIEDALGKATRCSREQLQLAASGRTDAGVHAWGQVAHFVTFHCFEDLEILHASLNGILPHDVRIREVSAVHPDFHARFSAQRKTYKYKAYVAPVMEPFQRSYAYHIRHQLNINAMQAAALYFVGKHDFSAFANASNDLSLRPPVREIVRFNVVATGPQFEFEVEGTGFLYRQVRNMVGLLIEVGKEVIPPSAVQSVLESQDRTKLARIARSAPPNGLYLMSVLYDESLL